MENNTLEQTEENVGELLRKSRLKLGKTIGDVGNELCIRKFYINAIESMDFENFPPLTYALGFIRSYAKYLNLNEERIIALYKQSMNNNHTEKKGGETPKFTTPAPRLKHILLSIFGIAAVFAIWSVLPISQTVDDYPLEDEIIVPKPEIITDTATSVSVTETNDDITDDNAQPDNETLTEEVSSQQEENTEKQEETIKQSQSTENTDNIQSQNDEVLPPKLRLVLTGPSWLEINKDGKTIISGVYKKGYEYEFPPVKGQVITVGRPRDAHFYLDDKEIVVATAMKRKNISLDKYFELQN